jgi:Uma2 family endonuclease
MVKHGVVSPPELLPADDYPDSDGQPLGETPRHVKNMCYTLEPLEVWLEDDPNAFVAGIMFVYYQQDDRNKHVTPDLFVVLGVPKCPDLERRRYLVWEEGKGPDLVIELTSESTREEDLETKLTLYRDTLKVGEYFLFDPYAECIDPPLQGYRLARGKYQRIRPVAARLPSKVLGLHLEAAGELLRFYDPATGKLLPIPPEERLAWQQAEEAQRHTRDKRTAGASRRQHAEAEVERLRREIEELRRRLPPEVK